MFHTEQYLGGSSSHTQLSLSQKTEAAALTRGDTASAAVLEKMQVLSTPLSREMKKRPLIIQILQEGALLCIVHVSIWGSVK